MTTELSPTKSSSGPTSSSSLARSSSVILRRDRQPGACFKLVESQSLTITGPAWDDFFEKSVFRRTFGEWVEYINPYIDQVFYMQTETHTAEQAALQLQSNYRGMFHKARPYAEWMSTAFSFDVPEAVAVLMRERAGWAYLRRRSTNVGEFLDLEGAEWEEYTDRKTSEFFYWNEEDNQYQWEKPQVFQRKLDTKELLKVGEEVMFIFPGRRVEEIAVITKVRFDDETGEDMYDLVHKYVPDMAFKWIARIHIKFVPKEGDALMLAKLEVKWKQLLRRKREADERKAKRDKELAMAAESSAPSWRIWRSERGLTARRARPGGTAFRPL